MHKNIRVRVLNDSENTDFTTKCVYNDKDNIVQYIENDNLNTIVKFDFNNLILTRKNKELRLRYHFVENKITEGEIEFIELNKAISVNIKTDLITRKKDYIDIKFQVEEEKINYILEVK